MASVLDLVKHYQHTIEKYPSDEQRILKCIDKLFNLDVTVQHLQDTGVGRTVNALRKEPGEVGQAARSLVSKWKLMVAAEESDQDNERNNDTSTYNGHDSRKDPESTSKQSRNSQDGYEKKSSSYQREQSQERNGSYSGNKRKYHSSEEEEPDLKKSKHNSSSDSDHKSKSEIKIKKENTESESEDYDSQTDESDSEMSESSKEEVKVKEEIKKDHSKDHKSSSSKHSSHTYHKDDKMSSKSKSYDSSEKYTKHHSSQPKERHSSEKSSSKERSTSHRHKSSTKEKAKDELLEKKHKSHKSSESEKSKKDSKSSSSKESNSDKPKSSHKSDSEKHKSSSEKHSNNSEKHTTSSEKHSIRSDKHKHSTNSSKEKEKHKNSSERESSSSKHKSKENGSKDKHSSSSKDKSKDRSTSKDKSSSHSEKHLSSDSKSSSSNDKSKNEKSDDKSSDKKSKQKSSSSSEQKNSKSGSGSSKSKDDVPKKKVQINSHTEDSDDGIDCESGASFAEALGMISPVKPKKKSLKDINSPINSFNNDLSPAALLAPNAKLAPLPALDISALPEISPNYKPRPPPKLLPHFTDEDAMNHVISSKNQRTKVYSGNKVMGKITSLYEMCVHVLQEHIDALEYTGGVPYEILKPVVDRATPQQLFVLEHYNPYLMEDTDHLWQKFCEKSFRNKKRHEMETWREMYMRCQEEQEHKLKSLTANIKLTQEAKKAPIKQTKMAYVDSVVKPPRNIAKKQAVHGTAHAATASPAARVAALSKAANVLRGNTRPSPATPVTASAINKPKKAPLMQKALQFMRGRKR